MLAVFVVFLLLTAAYAQRSGVAATAGYDGSRTSLQRNAGRLRPPLELIESSSFSRCPTSIINCFEGPLEELESLAVIDNFFLVGTGGHGRFGGITYYRYDRESPRFSILAELDGDVERLDYVPAYLDDVVILGGGHGIKAVRVSDGTLLWDDMSIGDTNGRYPFLAQDLAVYHGRNKVVAAETTDGTVIWQHAAVTAPAALAVSGNRIYFLEESGALTSLSLADGQQQWSSSPEGTASSSLIVTEKLVFVAHKNPEERNGIISAFRSDTGEIAWTREVAGLFPRRQNALVLAYDRLFAFHGGVAYGRVSAINPGSGALLWETSEVGVEIIGVPPLASTVLEYGLAADGMIYYSNQAARRIQARDAFTGILKWSDRRHSTLSALVAADASLIALYHKGTGLNYSVLERYVASGIAYFPHIADGGGQQTLITLSNLSGLRISGCLTFQASDGSPMALNVDGRGIQEIVCLEIAPLASTRVQTLGSSGVRAGWARADFDGPIQGSAVFQFRPNQEAVLFEAGVQDAETTGFAVLYAARQGRFNTGVAMANPLNMSANVTFRLLNREGTVVAEAGLVLPPDAQVARFIDELFTMELPAEFEGTLEVSSDVPIVLTALRTQDGYQMSSYPAGN